MNAIQNARAPTSPAATAPEQTARNRNSATETGADSFEQMLAARPASTPADGEAASLQAVRTEGQVAPSTIALPQALADMLRGAIQPPVEEREEEDMTPASGDAAPPAASTTPAPQPFPLVTSAPAQTAAIAAEPAPRPAPQAAVATAIGADGDEPAEGEVVAARSPPATGAARPERSSIMSALDEALQAPRQPATRERGDAADGPAQQKQTLEVDGVDTALAADEGVKVSFVSMSRSPAPVIDISAAAPTERPQAATPPAPPPPPTAAAHQLRLIMEPAGLGAVALNLSLSDARVSVDLEAQRGETRNALEANRDQLVDSLTGAGYDVAHVQVKTASTDAGFDPTRRDGASANDAPTERAQQERDESSRRSKDQEPRNGDHADDPHARPHRSGGVFI